MCAAVLAAPAPTRAQGVPASSDTAQVAAAPHQHTTTSWTVAVDGVLFSTFNRQGGPRGARDWSSQNWLMGAASRSVGAGRLTLTAMVTLEPLTVGGGGYAHLLQVGEAYRGLVNTDRQHPHELWAQLAVGWSRAVKGTTVTVIGGPSGEAAFGPPAFMHRASAVENPSAPLTHHTLDSTHIASSVLTARVDRAWASFEASAFRGREPDERHYNLDVGRPDSWSARLWVRPSPAWTLQVSHGYLKEPEQLEPGDQRRTSGSASWRTVRSNGFTAVTVAAGRTARTFSQRDALVLEGTHRRGVVSGYARAEWLEVETEALLFPSIVHIPHPNELADPVVAVTVGGIRDLFQRRGLTLGIGGDATTYRLPALLRVTHGERPWSFHVFLRLSRSDQSRRMFDMTMSGMATPGHTH
jgi:hypothetical protein